MPPVAPLPPLPPPAVSAATVAPLALSVIERVDTVPVSPAPAVPEPAGKARIVEMETAPMADAVRGLVAGLSVVFWCFATWLIPVLVAMGWWRHYLRGIPLTYEATLWSIIFPLGMYSVAGMYLGRADHLPIVEWIGATWLWVAVTAWVVVTVAMLRHIVLTVVARPKAP